MDKQIGLFHLKTDKVFRNEFECAAWYEDVLVKAGDYPVNVFDYRIMHFDDDRRKHLNGRVDGHCGGVYVGMSGTIVSDEFGARFCGMPISGYDNHKNAGKDAHHSMFAYMFSVVDSIQNDPETSWELFPEYEIRDGSIYLI